MNKNQEENIKYWTERAERNFVAGEKDALQVTKELQANYKRCVKAIEEKINAFYGKYANQNGLTLEEAKKLLDRTELREFKEYIAEMIKMGDKMGFTAEEMKQFNLLKIKAKISRLDELETNIRYELDKLNAEKVNKIGNMLENTYEESYYKAVYDVEQFKGFSSSFSGLNKEAVEKAVKTKWLGANYSERLWQNNLNRMTKMLNTEIPRGITLGYNPRKLAKEVSKNMQLDYNATVRVIRTEYSKVLNDATLKGYKASRIAEYEILATLEQKERTCHYCQELDYRNSGKAYKIEEAETSVNFPPFHPSCRCTTVPHYEEDEIDRMSDEELNKIGFITYEEWKNGLIHLEGDKVIYEKGVKIND